MARRKQMKVGARVYHNSNSSLDEGVIVFVSTNESNINFKNGKPYSVHWSNQTRGNYSGEEISRISPTKTLKQIKKEIEEDV
jgi:hypothetical protein